MKFTLGNVIGKTVKYTIIGTSKLSHIIGKTTSKAVTDEVTKEKILKLTEKVSSVGNVASYIDRKYETDASLDFKFDF